MKIKYQPTEEEIRKNRREEYLGHYPIEEQLEALTEASMGRPEKLEKLKAWIMTVKESFPKEQEV